MLFFRALFKIAFNVGLLKAVSKTLKGILK